MTNKRNRNKWINIQNTEWMIDGLSKWLIDRLNNWQSEWMTDRMTEKFPLQCLSIFFLGIYTLIAEMVHHDQLICNYELVWIRKKYIRITMLNAFLRLYFLTTSWLLYHMVSNWSRCKRMPCRVQLTILLLVQNRPTVQPSNKETMEYI